eukprot:1091967-Karenia_brevis.AAC.1
MVEVRVDTARSRRGEPAKYRAVKCMPAEEWRAQAREHAQAAMKKAEAHAIAKPPGLPSTTDLIRSSATISD